MIEQEIPFAYANEQDHIVVWGTHAHEVGIMAIRRCLHEIGGFPEDVETIRPNDWQKRWTGVNSVLEGHVDGWLVPKASTDIPWMTVPGF